MIVGEPAPIKHQLGLLLGLPVSAFVLFGDPQADQAQVVVLALWPSGICSTRAIQLKARWNRMADTNPLVFPHVTFTSSPSPNSFRPERASSALASA